MDTRHLRIAVAGATGTLGTHIVEMVRAAGHDPLPLSRATGVDLTAATGLADRLGGVDAVIDAATTTSMSARVSERFFDVVTRALLAAGHEAGVRHHVAVSIIGAAAEPHGYYAGKALQEQLVQAHPGGWTILRAAQFHEFAGQVAARGRFGPVHVVPRMRTQPVAAAEVARELVRLATGAPQGIARDIAGPQPENLIDLVRRQLAADGSRRAAITVPLPGAWGRALREGRVLPGPDALLAGPSFAEWLAAGASGTA